MYIKFETCIRQLCVGPVNDGGPVVRELLKVAIHAENRVDCQAWLGIMQKTGSYNLTMSKRILQD